MLAPGKLNSSELSSMLSLIVDKLREIEEVLVPPGPGLDAAVVKLTESKALVMTSDPITAAQDEIGYYAVHVNANDVAAVGGDPRWMLVTLLLPEGSPEELPVRIMRDISEEASKIEVLVLGGHTEITPGIDRPIASVAMIGEAETSKLAPSSNAKAGDLILMTKWAGLEGTAIACEEREELRGKLSEQLIEEGRSLKRYLSVLPEARIARELVPLDFVHAMHDPTEGGVVGGVYEMASASNLGFELWAHEVPVLPVTAAVCKELNLDPLKLISSGALLIAASPEGIDLLTSQLKRAGIHSRVIGRFLSDSERHVLLRDGVELKVEDVPKDEIWKLFT